MSWQEIAALRAELADVRKEVGGKKTRLGKDGKVETEDSHDIAVLKQEVAELKERLDRYETVTDVKTGQLLVELSTSNNQLESEIKEASE